MLISLCKTYVTMFGLVCFSRCRRFSGRRDGKDSKEAGGEHYFFCTEIKRFTLKTYVSDGYECALYRVYIHTLQKLHYLGKTVVHLQALHFWSFHVGR